MEKAAASLDLGALEKAKLTKENIYGALLSACSAHDPDPKKQLKIIRYLVKKGADVNEMDKNGVTCLHWAVRFRSPAAVNELLRLGAEINRQDKKSHSTALHRAVTHTGAPKTKNKDDEIKEIVEILLAGGADPKLKNKLGKKPIEYVKDAQLKKLIGKQKY